MLDRRWFMGCALLVVGCGSGLEDPDPSDEAGLPPGTKVEITGVSVSVGAGGGAVTSTVTTTGAGGAGTTATTGAGGAGGAPPCVPTPAVLSCAGFECGIATDTCGGMLDCGLTCTASTKGSTCLNLAPSPNECGCSLVTHCALPTHQGAACLAGGICGCNSGADCTASGRGKACAASVCGCTVLNELADCAGIGTGLCNASTLTCM